MTESVASASPAEAQDLLCEAQRALDLARRAGAEDAVATLRQHDGGDLTWRAAAPEHIQQEGSRTLTFEVFLRGRRAVHATSDLEPGRLAAFVQRAVALTGALEPDPHRRMTDPELGRELPPADAIDVVDPAVADLPRADAFAACRRIEEAAQADDRVRSVTTRVAWGRGTTVRVTTDGFEGTQARTWSLRAAEVQLAEGERRRPEGYHQALATHRGDLAPSEAVGAEGLARARARLGARKVASRRCPMVVTAEAAASLVGRILPALGADAIFRSASFLAGQEGRQIGSTLLDLIDDPLVPRALGSRRFDPEGLAARRLVLFERGVLRNHYVDVYYGGRLGWKPTTCSPSNVILPPGTEGPEALLRRAGDAILVTSWLGGNADLASGTFSYGIRGHVVRGGAVEEPVAEMNVTGVLPDLLSRLVGVADDPWPWRSMRVPTLLFEGVQFSGA